MNVEDYRKITDEIAKKLDVSHYGWGESGRTVAQAMNDETLEYIIADHARDPIGWIPGWVEICKEELDRRLEKIIF